MEAGRQLRIVRRVDAVDGVVGGTDAVDGVVGGTDARNRVVDSRRMPQMMRVLRSLLRKVSAV